MRIAWRLYAVDVDFDHGIQNQDMAGSDEPIYPSIFKVHPSALWHDLYVALGSGIISAKEIWKLTLPPKRNTRKRGEAIEKPHDEL